MSKQPDPDRTNDRRVIPWLLVGLVVLFGGVYVAAYLTTSDRVPRGATVEGVALGGLKPAAARAKLREALADPRTAPLRVAALGRVTTIEPAEAGLDVDLDASVEQAGGGRSWSPARIWAALTDGEDHAAVVTVDDAALTQQVATFADRVDVPARDGSVTFRGTQPVARDGRTGEVVDREHAETRILNAYLNDDGERIELPVRVVDPDIDASDVSQAQRRFANPAVSQPVTLLVAGKRLSVAPRAFAPALSMTAKDGELVPRVDEEVLTRRLAPSLREVELAPRNARVALVDGRPRVIPARRGVAVAKGQVVDGFLAVLTKDGTARRLRVGTVPARPEVTTREARALGIREVVSEFTTYYPHADYRNTNLGRAAALINGTVLEPGEVFSLNGIVGERTAANGFAKGFIISDGVFLEDFGGGVSQVATTTFNAMFFAGLEDVEHQPHSFYIDRYPVGREATVVWPYVDLRFRNDTPHGVLVQASIDPSTPSTSGAMTVRMWSTKTWRIEAGQSARRNFTEPATRQLSGPTCVPNTGYGGFDIDVYRSFYRPGSDDLVRRETFSTTYTPSDTVICRP